MKPRIAVVAQFPLSVLSGSFEGRGGNQSATWLPQLALAWQHQDQFDVHWCVLDRSAKAETLTKKWNQYFHSIPTPSMTTSLLLARAPQRRAFDRLFNKIAPDIVHCWGTENLNGAALEIAKCPSILSMQGVIDAIYETGDLPGWRWRMLKWLERRSIHHAETITCESEWAISKTSRIDDTKPTEIVEYGVHPSFYAAAWEPTSDNPRFLFAGSLSRLKGVDILLEMLKSHPNRKWTFAFAGDGYFAESLRSLDDPKVEVLGSLRTDELQKEMSRSWGLVHPSRADSSPNVVKEARVVGLPIVASIHGGHAEYVKDGVDGLKVLSEAPEAWFAALDTIASDFEMCLRMGTTNHETYRSHFNAANTSRAFLELYDSLIKKKTA